MPKGLNFLLFLMVLCWATII